MRTRQVPCAAAITLVVLVAAAPARSAVTYSLDDGTAESGVGLTPPGGSVFFANRFTAAPGGEKLTSISIAYGVPAFPGAARTGTPVQLLVFKDAEGRATPERPVLLASAPDEVTNPGTNTFNRVAIDPTVVDGTFFVGVLVSGLPSDGRFPIAFDRSTAANQSFAAFFSTPVQIGRLESLVYEPSRNSSSIGNIDLGAIVRVVDGNFMIRAEGVPVPEPSAAMAAVPAAAALAMRRRRRA